MTEQEQIAAIDALAAMILLERRNVQWEHMLEQDREAFRHGTVSMLRNMHEKDMLEDYAICYRVMDKPWVDATPQERAICDKAAQAMREVKNSTP